MEQLEFRGPYGTASPKTSLLGDHECAVWTIAHRAGHVVLRIVVRPDGACCGASFPLAPAETLLHIELAGASGPGWLPLGVHLSYPPARPAIPAHVGAFIAWAVVNGALPVIWADVPAGVNPGVLWMSMVAGAAGAYDKPRELVELRRRAIPGHVGAFIAWAVVNGALPVIWADVPAGVNPGVLWMSLVAGAAGAYDKPRELVELRRRAMAGRN